MDAWKKALIHVACIASAGACGPVFAQTHAVQAQIRKATFADPPSQRLWKIAAQPVSATHGLGEPIFVDFQVTNLGAAPASIDLGGDGKANLRVTTTEPNGLSRPVQLRHGGLQGFGTHMVGPHATYTERLILNEWNGFREAGEYAVTIALVPAFGPKADDPPVADLQVSIGPRNESKLRSVARALADRAIDGYGVGERGAAGLALSYVADPVAVPEMVRVLSSGRAVGSPLIWALARLGGPSARDALRLARSNPNDEIRYAADAALRMLREGKPAVRPEIAD
jgi:hypothetical protein